MSYDCTDAWPDLISALERAKILNLSKRAEDSEGPALSTEEATRAIQSASKAITALRKLVELHDEKPSMLTRVEWQAARRALKDLPK